MTDINESVGLAGWLFADLLLGLVVIFLAIGFVFTDDSFSEATVAVPVATITVPVATITVPVATITVPTTTTLKVCPGIEPPREDLKQQGIQIAWTTDDPGQLRAVVGEFLNNAIAVRLQDKGLDQIDPEDISIGYVLAFAGAGLSPSVSQEEAARARAKVFIEQLEEVMPDRFADLDGRPSWSRGSTSIISVWYFPKVPSTDGSC